jgi:hypothetical protein
MNKLREIMGIITAPTPINDIQTAETQYTTQVAGQNPPVNPLLGSDDNPKKSIMSKLNINPSRWMITLGFSLIIAGSFFNWMSDYSNPPVRDDFDFDGSGDIDGSENDAYSNATNEYPLKIRDYEGISVLMYSTGPVIIGLGLLGLCLDQSCAVLPKWVRVALMAGTMVFLIRLLTTDISLIDMAIAGII